MNWETTATMVAVLTPLVGVPMSIMTFYLRAIREGQDGRLRETCRRVESLEQQARGLGQLVEEVARDYTTKEEWLRESLLARKQLERLTEMAARLAARLEDGEGLVGHLARASDAILELARRLTPVGE